MAPSALQQLAAHVVGFSFSVVAPIWILRRGGRRLWLAIASERGISESEATKMHRSDLPFLVGLVERVLLTGSVVAGAQEFVAVWLAIKVAGSWNVWSEGREVPGRSERTYGRHEFNSFLIGSGLSLMFAFVGALSIHWMTVGLCLMTAGVYAFSILFALAVYSESLRTWAARIDSPTKSGD